MKPRTVTQVLVAAMAILSAAPQARAEDVLLASQVRARVFLDRNNPAYGMDMNQTSRFFALYRRFGHDGREPDANDARFFVDPSDASNFRRLERLTGYGEREHDANNDAYYMDPNGQTRVNRLVAHIVYETGGTSYYRWDGNGTSQGIRIQGAFGGDRCHWNLYGACVQMYANEYNPTGGGLMVSDDGGWVDHNDGWISFAGSNGLDMNGRNVQMNGGPICLGSDCRTNWPAGISRRSTLHQRDKGCGTGGGGVLTSNGEECCNVQVNCHCSGWWGRGCWWGRGGSQRCDNRRECNGFRGFTQD